MKRYIYEMVTFEPFGKDAANGFHVAYHFEDYFASRKAAIKFVAEYMLWATKNEIINEAMEMNWASKTNSMVVCWKTWDGKKVEYYGFTRNMILA